MTRTYTKKKRAEQQAETRQRIVEAAVELHSTIGPANTNVSMVAERAGVQRHTLYAHFPDERSLLMACSGHTAERFPPPDAVAWKNITDVRERLTVGLGAIYAWFEANSERLSNVLRDAEIHALTKEVSTLRFGPVMKGWNEVLGAKLNAKQRAMLRLALSFFTWRTLVQQTGLKTNAAVAIMVHAIENAKE
jgi:AcrR family transcriptional regulator